MAQFEPKESTRASEQYFAELLVLNGPVGGVGVVGAGTFAELHGLEYVFLMQRDPLELQVFIWNETGGRWDRVTDDLPPFPTLTGRERRLAGAFDQSGRLNFAYELDGTVYVTRYDAAEQEYTDDVTFSGVNPSMLNDAEIHRFVGDSDVVLFYQLENDPNIYSRVQRETYATERQIEVSGELPESTILDRVLPIFLRYEALLSDGETGLELDLPPVSDLYPYYLNASLDARAEVLAAIVDSVQTYALSMGVNAAAEVIAVLTSTLTTYTPSGAFTAEAEVLAELKSAIAYALSMAFSGTGEVMGELLDVGTAYNTKSMDFTGDALVFAELGA